MRKSDYAVDFPDENLKPLNLPECIYLSERYKCGILNVKECLGEKCTFCKTFYQRDKSVNSWFEHLNSLAVPKQERIANVYYGGKMPWKKGN